MKSQIADFVSLIYPRTCVVCSKSLTKKEDYICLACQLTLPKRNTDQRQEHLMSKFFHVAKVKRAYAFLDYLKSGSSQKLVHALKYKGKKGLGVWLGQEFGRMLVKENVKCDLIIPVPLHPSRLRARGFNQSEMLALGINDIMHLRVETGLVKRRRQTKTQTKRSKIKRWESMADVYEIIDGEAITGNDIMVVDDVITTGATLGVLCEEISNCSPNSIVVVSLAAGK